MVAIEVHPEIFKRLKQAYIKQCGRSPRKLMSKLNDKFKYEVSPNQNLIAERTIRSFFNDEPTPKMREENLNYLCTFLLNYNSYDEALNQFQPPSIHVQRSWLESYWEKIERECNTIKILTMNKSKPLNDLFVKVNTLEGIKGRRVKAMQDLWDERRGRSRDFNNFGQVVIERGVSGEEVVKHNHKVMIWGTAGAGKTTFLKYLAMYAPKFLDLDNQENITEKPLPFLIPLKIFAENKHRPSLADALIQEFSTCILSELPSNIQKQLEQFIRGYLERGQCLILLDGLDEVLAKDINYVYESINKFNEKYTKNSIVITCRYGACEYVFKDFVEVEIAEFDEEQIKGFIRQWFKNSQEDRIEHFLLKLETNQSVKELAKNPLLLTLLCLVAAEGYDLPRNRYSLYEDAVDVLLRKWDATRNIERENVYGELLSRQRKINMLGEIAYNAFIQKPQQYFWHKYQLADQIGKFIENIDGIKAQVDSQLVLKTIETDHGILTEQARSIYAFSHLTFQEYFTAQHILESRDPNCLNKIINQHLTDYQWREVFLIITGRLHHADNFLKAIFSHANKLVESDELQKILKWLNEVTTSFEISSSSWRAMYLTLALDTDLYIDRNVNVDRNIAQIISIKLRDNNEKREKIIKPKPKSFIAVNLSVIHSFAIDKGSSRNWTMPKTSPFVQERLDVVLSHFKIESKFDETVNLAIKNNYVDLADDLKSLQSCQPNDDTSASKWKDWADKLQKVMIQHLNVGYNVELSEKDTKALDEYLYVINLLLDCLQADSYISRDLRDELIDYLLLPKESILPHLLRKELSILRLN